MHSTNIQGPTTTVKFLGISQSILGYSYKVKEKLLHLKKRQDACWDISDFEGHLYGTEACYPSAFNKESVELQAERGTPEPHHLTVPRLLKVIVANGNAT